MIHYQLRCGQQHQFDGWFRDSESFDKQAGLRLIACPECGGTDVERALMAPAVSKGAQVPAPVPPQTRPGQAAVAPIPAKMLAMLQKIRAAVEEHCDYVGPAFADEVRRMHEGEAEQRPVYGEASDEQAERLVDEGIDIARIPWVPRAEG
jgi:hypothetical protein